MKTNRKVSCCCCCYGCCRLWKSSASAKIILFSLSRGKSSSSISKRKGCSATGCLVAREDKDKGLIGVNWVNRTEANAYLIHGIIVRPQVGMCESLFNGDSMIRIERQHLVEQIQCVRVGIPANLTKRSLGLHLKRLEISTCFGVRYTVQILVGWRAELFKN